MALLTDFSFVSFSSLVARNFGNWVTNAGRICSVGEISMWTQQTQGAFGNLSHLAYFTWTQLEGKNKFQNVRIILKASYSILLQSPQSLDITKFILDVKTQELICSCIKSSAVLEQNPSKRDSFCWEACRLWLQKILFAYFFGSKRAFWHKFPNVSINLSLVQVD